MAGGSGFNGLLPWQLPALAGSLLIFPPCDSRLLCHSTLWWRAAGTKWPSQRCRESTSFFFFFCFVFLSFSLKLEGRWATPAFGSQAVHLQKLEHAFCWAFLGEGEDVFFFSFVLVGEIWEMALPSGSNESAIHTHAIDFHQEMRGKVAAEVNLEINSVEHISFCCAVSRTCAVAAVLFWFVS